MSTLTVYYTEENNTTSAEPYNLLKHFTKNILSNSFLLQCPAFTDVINNTYFVNSLINLNFEWQDTSIKTDSYTLKKNLEEYCSKTPELFSKVVDVKEPKSGLVSLGIPRFAFFCEEPLLLELGSPVFHSNHLSKNSVVIPGRYDISKHFRFLESPLLLKNFGEISIKEDDTIYYIKFLTDKKIKLKRFYFDKKIMFVNPDMNLRGARKPKPLSWYYDLWFKFKNRERLLKYIKSNLL